MYEIDKVGFSLVEGTLSLYYCVGKVEVKFSDLKTDIPKLLDSYDSVYKRTLLVEGQEPGQNVVSFRTDIILDGLMI